MAFSFTQWKESTPKKAQHIMQLSSLEHLIIKCTVYKYSYRLIGVFWRLNAATHLIFHLQLLSQISPTPPAPAWTGLLHCFAAEQNKASSIFTFVIVIIQRIQYFIQALWGLGEETYCNQCIYHEFITQNWYLSANKNKNKLVSVQEHRLRLE